ncbi:MAG: glucose 1-dehydrogenase [Desulfacinum sp.]|nr:glucose 1-dehydrogenase [Desulfacinum sp.]
MFELNGKVAIVTGAARGIGKAIARVLAVQGAQVVVADMLEEEGQQTVKEITRDGGRAKAVAVDVTDLDQVQAMVRQTRNTFGPVDILVNNAGWDKMQLFTETTPELWDKIIAINYKGVLNCVSAVLPEMMKRKQGRIISIASDAARVGSTGEAVYAGAKGAVIAFSKSIAREVARYQITVNVVCPGPTPTPLVEGMIQESELAKKVFPAMEKIIPLRRMGKPDEIAAAVVFLASDDAAFITGQTLSVSGGLTMA